MSRPEDDEIVGIARLRELWRGVLESRFAQHELCDFLTLVQNDLPEDSLLREIGRVQALDRARPENAPHAVALKNTGSWPKTRRIDGILPLHLPLASDITLLSGELVERMDRLGLGLPRRGTMATVEQEVGLCLLAWLHGRKLRADYDMLVELRSCCPRSALAAREELTVMGFLPNGSRITVFYSSLKGRQWLTMPDASVEHMKTLWAARDEAGRLCIRGRGYGGQS